jgi:hypothetical protein
VKYMLLIYMNQGFLHSLPEEEQTAIMNEVGTIMEELQQSGEWVGGEALADASQSKVVRVKDGVPAITDGPYLEAKEHLAGYCVIQCDTEERALEIAARWPDARYNGIELRPMMTPGGAEM